MYIKLSVSISFCFHYWALKRLGVSLRLVSCTVAQIPSHTLPCLVRVHRNYQITMKSIYILSFYCCSHSFFVARDSQVKWPAGMFLLPLLCLSPGALTGLPGNNDYYFYLCSHICISIHFISCYGIQLLCMIELLLKIDETFFTSLGRFGLFPCQQQIFQY